ncbi:MAG: nucleotidyltransferase domain-containing protein [Candidatus Thermoplasmatota archaeon]|nr:nucleotidyltransferase domain-containing protein [Candidatus Thermoplasmatota archaeon]
MKPNNLKAYASTFASFLLRKLEDKISDIDAIILYGSVAKGEATKESDVDIFIDTKKDFREEIREITEKFYGSREAMLFKAKGTESEINTKVGELKEWTELHRSIASTGITLWGKYRAKEMPIGSRHKIIFYWDKIEKNRGAFLNKLYGYKSGNKRYPGLLEEIGGRKVGKSGIIIPIESKHELIELIKKYKVRAKSLEIFALE